MIKANKFNIKYYKRFIFNFFTFKINKNNDNNRLYFIIFF